MLYSKYFSTIAVIIIVIAILGDAVLLGRALLLIRFPATEIYKIVANMGRKIQK